MTPMPVNADVIVAATMATEIPPVPIEDFTGDMIMLAMDAVSDVIRNRVRAPGFPKTAVEVCLQPHQFSAVRLGDDLTNYWVHALAGRWEPDHVNRCLFTWQSGPAEVAGDALFYYSPISMKPRDRVPDWVTGKTEILVPGLSREWFRFYA